VTATEIKAALQDVVN